MRGGSGEEGGGPIRPSPGCLRVGCPKPSEAVVASSPPPSPPQKEERKKASWEGRKGRARGRAAFPAWLRMALRAVAFPGGLRPPRLGEGFPRGSRGCLLVTRDGAGRPGWGEAEEPLASARGPGAPGARPTARGRRAAEKKHLEKGLTLKRKIKRPPPKIPIPHFQWLGTPLRA